MSLFISKVINSAIQIILFALIPFIWWLVTARKECSFFEWIGLKRARAGESNKPLLWVAGMPAVFFIGRNDQSHPDYSFHRVHRMAYGIYKRKENRRVNSPRLADPFDSQHLFGTKRSIRIIFVENR